MHLLRAETVTLDQSAEAVDLGLSPADILFLSFTDSDLAGLVTAWRNGKDHYPSLRAANLNQLKHPYSVDLIVEKLLPNVKFVFVRLLGGKDYWSYGVEELSRASKILGFHLAIVPGDYQADPRLDTASSLRPDFLKTLWQFFHEGGRENLTHCLDWIAAHLGYDRPISEPSPIKAVMYYHDASRAAPDQAPRALIVAYRSVMIAEDTAPLIALADALAERGFAVDCLCVSSLKDPQAVTEMAGYIDQSKPSIILNTTAFSAKLDDGTTVLDRAKVPVLQAILATTQEEPWAASTRGLSATDIAMNVVLPELDGRIVTRAISFKAEAERSDDIQFTRIVHKPMADRIYFVADLARNWVRLQKKSTADRKLACVLADYPHKGGRAGYAVGLDTPESIIALTKDLQAAGYSVSDIPDAATLMSELTIGAFTASLSVQAYEVFFKTLPSAFRESVLASWGEIDKDPMIKDGAFGFRVIETGNLIIALQPSRGSSADIKAEYHDATRPPSHAYIAFYLWLTRTKNPDAMIHFGTHGTLEWLPGKSVALANDCAPEILIGALPVIYPFIVNNPGEAAQAKRRLAAVTIGHLTPPLTEAGSHGAAIEIEGLLDEYSSAQSLDPRRATMLAELIMSRARETGLMNDAGLKDDLDTNSLLSELDAWLCDLKEMRIADGLHIFGRAASHETTEENIRAMDDISDPQDALTRLSASPNAERDGLLAALDGRFIAAGPAGAPSRGRVDVLPTGRNLYTIDPRSVPTRTAWEIGKRTAEEVVARYAQDHGDWPQSVVIDLWGSATMRTGGDDLAQALALLGVRPVWEASSSRVTGFEILPPASFGRPRIDVTLRISGLFRDVFPSQIALFDEAVQSISQLDETAEENPLAAKRRLNSVDPLRIFGSAPGTYGLGLGEQIARGQWQDQAELGEAYLTSSSYAYRSANEGVAAPSEFRAQIASADAFVHVQDMAEQDILDSDAFAEHEGGFAAAAKSLGAKPTLYHVDATKGGKPAKVRTVKEEVARVLNGRATNPRWIKGQMRHGWRGATEIAETVQNLYAYASLTDAVESRHFDRLFDATLGNDEVSAFLKEANPSAAQSIADTFLEAEKRGFWTSRRNSTRSALEAFINEAAE
ncbi:MAG: cobaltochelatase subunit CobN [Beijerinckiaceae bacterium]|nr:cobaltochelatase subunit CobN [Beijerinckiaceae bacterium]